MIKGVIPADVPLLFKHGLDTQAIADLMGLAESQVYNLLASRPERVRK